MENDHDVMDVFDRYIEGSIKTHEHNRTAGVYITCPNYGHMSTKCQ